MGNLRESSVGHMPELSDFGMIYCAVGNLRVLDLAIEDSLPGNIAAPQPLPDMP